MGTTTSLACPRCETETEHWLVARTRLHLGVKRKWECDACEHRVVTINDAPLGTFA